MRPISDDTRGVIALSASGWRMAKQATTDIRGEGRFRQWAQILDWIVQQFSAFDRLWTVTTLRRSELPIRL